MVWMIGLSVIGFPVTFQPARASRAAASASSRRSSSPVAPPGGEVLLEPGQCFQRQPAHHQRMQCSFWLASVRADPRERSRQRLAQSDQIIGERPGDRPVAVRPSNRRARRGSCDRRIARSGDGANRIDVELVAWKEASGVRRHGLIPPPLIPPARWRGSTARGLVRRAGRRALCGPPLALDARLAGERGLSMRKVKWLSPAGL